MIRSVLRRWLPRAAMVLAAACLAVAALIACSTPFIPIPPPADPTFTPVVTTETGAPRTVWETRGAPAAHMASAKVFVFNLDAGHGAIVRAAADGSYVAGPIEGVKGDRVQIYYQDAGGQRSPDICRLLAEGLARTDCGGVDGGRDR